MYNKEQTIEVFKRILEAEVVTIGTLEFIPDEKTFRISLEEQLKNDLEYYDFEITVITWNTEIEFKGKWEVVSIRPIENSQGVDIAERVFLIDSSNQKAVIVDVY